MRVENPWLRAFFFIVQLPLWPVAVPGFFFFLAVDLDYKLPEDPLLYPIAGAIAFIAAPFFIMFFIIREVMYGLWDIWEDVITYRQ